MDNHTVQGLKVVVKTLFIASMRSAVNKRLLLRRWHIGFAGALLVTEVVYMGQLATVRYVVKIPQAILIKTALVSIHLAIGSLLPVRFGMIGGLRFHRGAEFNAFALTMIHAKKASLPKVQLDVAIGCRDGIAIAGRGGLIAMKDCDVIFLPLAYCIGVLAALCIGCSYPERSAFIPYYLHDGPTTTHVLLVYDDSRYVLETNTYPKGGFQYLDSGLVAPTNRRKIFFLCSTNTNQRAKVRLFFESKRNRFEFLDAREAEKMFGLESDPSPQVLPAQF